MEKSITIIEPSILFYEGLTAVLERNSSYKVIYTSDKFIHSKVKLGDILMMDINIFLKWKDLIFGLTLQRTIKIITFANENEAELVIEAIKEGVDAFLLREIDSNEIYNCIECVMEDKMYVHGRATDYLIEKSYLKVYKNSNFYKDNELSVNELNVLNYIAKGLTNKEIAENMGLSEKTIKSHVSNMFLKIGVTNRTALLVKSIKNGLINI